MSPRTITRTMVQVGPPFETPSAPATRGIAAIYARVSTTVQREEGTSLQTQIAACRAKAKELGYDVPDELVLDEDWPGTTLDRPRFDGLRTLARDGAIQALIAYDTDRLSRGDPIKLAVVVEELEGRGCQVHLVTTPLDNSPEGQLLQYVRGWAARFEHAKIKERTARGRRETARKGLLPTGQTLYGYDYIRKTNDEHGRCEINPEQAEVVRTIYRWYVEDGLTLGRIAIRLTDTQVTPPTHGRGDKRVGGGRWHISTIARILSNTSYCGQAQAFKWIAVPPKNPKPGRRRYVNTRHEPRPADQERYDVSGVVPAVITPELFAAAQAMRKRNAAMSQRNRKRDYLLSGHIFCAWCRRRYGATASRDWRYYVCPGGKIAARSERCRNQGLGADQVEADVWARVEAVLLNPSVIMQAVRDQRSDGHGAEAVREDIERIEAALARLGRQEQRMIRMYRYGEIDDAKVDAEVAEIKMERVRLTAERDALTQRLDQQQAATRSLESVAAYCERVRRQLRTFDYTDRRLAVEALGIRVIADSKSWRVEAALPFEVGISSQPSNWLGINSADPQALIVELPPAR